MTWNRETRGLVQRKLEKPQIKDHQPLDSEGSNGELSIRKLAEGVFLFFKGLNKWFKIFNSGNHMIPDKPNAYDIGSQHKPWKKIFVSDSGLHLGNTKSGKTKISTDGTKLNFTDKTKESKEIVNIDSDGNLDITATGSGSRNGAFLLPAHANAAMHKITGTDTSLLQFKTNGSAPYTVDFPQGILKLAEAGTAPSGILGNQGRLYCKSDNNPWWMYEGGTEVNLASPHALVYPTTITSTTAPQFTIVYASGEQASFSVNSAGVLAIATLGSGTNDSDLILDADGDIDLKANGSIAMDAQLTIISTTSRINLMYDASNYSRFTTTSTGGLLIGTAGEGDEDSPLTFDIEGSIIFDAANGSFLVKNAGTEFSVADSSYAGMILGYTTVGKDATPAKYDVLASMRPVHDDLKVTFKAPPSGAVEVFASIFVDIDRYGIHLTLGLSTQSATEGWLSLGAQYENFSYVGATVGENHQHSHRWIVTGLTPGAIDTYWFAAGASQATRIDLRWGGELSAVADGTEPSEYQPFIMKVTALPTAVTDYAVYG